MFAQTRVCLESGQGTCSLRTNINLFMPVILILLVIPTLPITDATSHGGRIIAFYAGSPAQPLTPYPPAESTLRSSASGVMKLLVILVYTSDVNRTLTPSQVREEFFGSQGNTVANYYHTVSYGAVTLKGDVVGWYKLGGLMADYGRDCGTMVDDPGCTGSPTSWWLARDAVQAIGHSVNFTKYDYFVFVHAGIGQESNQHATNALWSITYMYGVALTAWDKTIESFSIVPELEFGGASSIGVYCAELGHQLGLPDLFDRLTGEPNMGAWSVEDLGMWNGNPRGSSPAEMEAWSRIKVGFMANSLMAVALPGTLSNYTLQPLETSSNGLHVIKVPLGVPIGEIASATQYYLIENREHVGFDKALPSTGVLITYVNDVDQYKGLSLVRSSSKSRNLSNATWNIGQTFSDQWNGVQIAITGKVGDAYQVIVNRAGALPDLAVAMISTQPSQIVPEANVNITATIINQGSISTPNVPVQILLDGKILQTSRVTLEAGQSTHVSATWKAKSGNHQIKVIIDPSNTVRELTRSNKTATKNLSVGPIVKVSIPL